MMVPHNSNQGSCGCGRTASPTGDCDGSHSLNEVNWQRVKDARELAEYQKQAAEFWSDSCTTPRSSK